MRTGPADGAPGGAELEDGALRVVPADWRLLAKAFSDDTGGVQWYVHALTGRIVRTVEGEPPRQGVSPQQGYLAIERARSKEQYRWMEQFIGGLSDPELAAELSQAVAGKRAFQRFKAVLWLYPEQLEEWQSFRAEQLARHIRSWLRAHGLSVPEPRAETAIRDSHVEGPPPRHLVPLEVAMAGLPTEDLEDLLAAGRFLLGRARALELEWDDRELGAD